MKFFAPLLGLLVFCGCVHTVTKDGLEDVGMEHAARSFPDQTYYVGSEGDFDYFVIRNGSSERMRRYRVPKAEEAVKDRFGRTKDETEWREYGNQMVVTNGARIGR